MPVSIDKTPGQDDATGWSATAISYNCGEVDLPHYHPEGQVLFATRGVMLVETAHRRWVIPPQRALWIPPFVSHSYRLLSPTELRAVYISSTLMTECTNITGKSRAHMINAGPLVKELISALFRDDYCATTKKRMALLLMDVISEVPSVSAELPMPRDERLFRAAGQRMLSHRWKASLTDMADAANVSERSFSRLFLQDTGFSFRTWKQRARIYASLDLLAENVPVKQIAWQLGFSSSTAFSTAFLAVMGVTPGEF